MFGNSRNRWLTVDEACQLAGVSRSTLGLFIKARVFKTCQMVAPGKVWGRRLVEKKSLLAYMDKIAAKQQGKVEELNEIKA